MWTLYTPSQRGNAESAVGWVRWAIGDLRPRGAQEGGTGSTMLRMPMLVLALTGCLACPCFGCGDREAASAPPSLVGAADSDTPRWVHRYVPRGLATYRPEEDRWRPESEVPRAPQTTPGMVIWEVSEYVPGMLPTSEQQRVANDFVERCYAAALRHGWDKIERGLADGYRRVDRNHYRKDEFMLDDHVLDPDRPEVLMYYATPPDGKGQLAGFMFYAKDREARGPQFGGPLTLWHYHSWHRSQCIVDGLAMNWSLEGKCERGEPSYFSGEMIHVWLLDHPEGQFATPMYLPLSVLEPALEKRRRERGF